MHSNCGKPKIIEIKDKTFDEEKKSKQHLIQKEIVS